MRQFRLIVIALITSLAVINAVFLRKTIAVLLCGVVSFNSTSCYSFLAHDGEADAAVPPHGAATTPKAFRAIPQKELKIAGCFLGVCVNLPKIPVSIPSLPSGSQNNPTPPASPPSSEPTKPTATANPQSNASFAGKWRSDWGPVEFNSNLTGSWDQGHSQPGQIKDGSYDPQTRQLVFHYYQPWNEMDGTATLTLSADGNQLSGSWTQQKGSNPPGSGGSGFWVMTRDRVAKQEVTANAMSRPVADLSGTWISTGSLFTVDKRGCTAGYAGRITTSNGEDLAQGFEFTLTQNGNQLSVPDKVIDYSGPPSGSYTQHIQGTISGSTVNLTISALQGSTFENAGSVSSDGNTVSGTVFCKSPTGSATANGNFTWTRKQADFVLTRATTTDAKSVDVIYRTTDTIIKVQSIHFDVYRSSTQNFDPVSSRRIEISKQEEIQDETNSDQHLHGVQLTFQDKEALKPNTAFPYVVAVATYNGKQSTTYFKKYLLGSVSHGFNRWNKPYIVWFAGYVYNFIEIVPNWIASLYQYIKTGDPGTTNLRGIPDWENNMANSLKNIDKYDDAISFDWTATCAVDEPGLAVKAGDELASQILEWVSTHSSQHEGDIVDIHLIGHSRGSVVVTQALNSILPVLKQKKYGSYMELTLLDPHPASNKFGASASIGISPLKWASENSKNLHFVPKDNVTLAALAIWTKVISDFKEFQDRADDPALKIPQGVKNIDVWYQKTRVDHLSNAPDQEYFVNLYGLIDAIKNESGLPIEWHDRTAPGVGHNQIPDIYEKQVVETGMLNRSTL